MSSTKSITSALISVFSKDGLEPIVKKLNEQGVTIYSTGGTQKFINELGIQVVPVEDVTSYPSIFFAWVSQLEHNIRQVQNKQKVKLALVAKKLEVNEEETTLQLHPQ